jgi:hypothetical protein
MDEKLKDVTIEATEGLLDDLIPIGLFRKDNDLTFNVNLHTAGILDKLSAGDYVLFASKIKEG